MKFTPQAFVENLYYLGLGMLGIFVAVGLIIGLTYFLRFACKPKTIKNEDNTIDKKE